MQHSAVPHPSASVAEQARRSATLLLELTALRNRKGVVNVALFSSQDGFPNNAAKAIRSGCFPISELPLVLPFDNLPYGKYAISVHHDENMDSKLNCNALGIPIEGIGFSGNPHIWMGVPPFHRTAVEFSLDRQTVSITMKYLLP